MDLLMRQDNANTRLRRRWGDGPALQAALTVDEIDRQTGLALTQGWRPLAFDSTLPPVPEMENRTC